MRSQVRGLALHILPQSLLVSQEADGVQHGMSSNERAKYRQGEDERGPHIPQEIHCEGTSTTHYYLIATAYNIIGRSLLKETPLGGRIPQQQSRDMPTS